MDRLELVMDEGDPHQGRNLAGGVDEAFQVEEEVANRVRRGRHVPSGLDRIVLGTDEVLARPYPPRLQVAPPHSFKQELVQLSDQADRDGAILRLAQCVDQGLEVVLDLLGVALTVPVRETGRLVQDEIGEIGAGALDPARRYRLPPQKRADQNGRIGQIRDRLVQPPEGKHRPTER